MMQVNVPNEELASLIEEQLAAGKTVKFSPKGRSMLPMLREGRDTVTLCAVTAPLKKYDIGFYLRSDGRYVLHRIVKVKETISCCGDRQFSIEKGLSPEQFIAVVCAFTRDGKERSVTSMRYRMYCRLLHGSRPLRYLAFRIAAKLKKLFKCG